MNIICLENMALGTPPDVEDGTVFFHVNFTQENKNTKIYKSNSNLVLIECKITNCKFPDDTQVYCGSAYDGTIETEEIETDIPPEKLEKEKEKAAKKYRPIRFVGNRRFSKTVKEKKNSEKQTKVYPSIPEERWNLIMTSPDLTDRIIQRKYAAHIKKARLALGLD